MRTYMRFRYNLEVMHSGGSDIFENNESSVLVNSKTTFSRVESATKIA